MEQQQPMVDGDALIIALGQHRLNEIMAATTIQKLQAQITELEAKLPKDDPPADATE